MKKLKKAKFEAGVLFHSPGSPTIAKEFAPKDPSFSGETHQPNPAVKFNASEDQKALEPYFNQIHSSPNFEEFYTPGNFSKGENAKLVTTPEGKFIAKKSQEFHPSDRKDFGVDDRVFSQGEREMAYHNAAHKFFGMGKHVPLAALASFPEKKEHWTMHKMVPDSYQHGPMADQNPVSDEEELKAVKNLHRKGVMAKALVMDGIMGNHDRHDGNIFYSPDDVQLIDHSMSLSTSPKIHIPSYYYTSEHYRLGGERIHPLFRQWLLDLNPDTFNKTLMDSGVPDAERKAALGRLQHAKQSMINATTKGNNYRKFFEEFIRSQR